MSQECPACGANAPDSAKFCPECGASFGDLTNLVGRTLAGKYEIQERIGEGSMGQIYLALHLGLEKRVAIKVLHRDVELGVEASQRFRREGVAAGRIQHRNAIEVFDFDTTEDGLTFLAMEFVDGRDLRQVIDQDGALAFDDASAIILQVLAALQAAHGLGIVHRDLKPANIMLATDTDRLKVKVLDFGLSKLVHRKIEASLTTIPGRIIGTPLYMAPEQSSGEEADARADLYAIGLIFYELLVGERPFQGKTLTELLYAQATEPVPLISETADDPDLPDHMDAFFQRALHRDRDHRFQSAKEMVAALLGEDDVEAPADDRPRRRTSDGRRRRKSTGSSLPIAAAIVGGLVVLGGGAFFLLSGSEPSPVAPEPVQPEPAVAANADAPRLRQRDRAARPDGASAYLAKLDEALLDLASGEVQKAEIAANAAFLSGLRDPEAFYVRGLVLRASGEGAAAVSDFVSAVDGDPSFDRARVELGWTQLGEGDVTAALASFSAVEEGSSVAADARAGRGRISLDRGDLAAARTDFEAAVSEDGECWRAHAGLGQVALVEGQAEDAVDAFSEARRWRPGDHLVLSGLGSAFLAAEDPDAAIDAFEAALALRDDHAESLVGMAASCLLAGRLDEVQPALDRLGVSGADDGRVTLLSVASAFGNEEFSDARATLAEIARTNPDRARLLELRAAAENVEGDHAAALESAERAVRVNRDRAGAHYQRGVALFGLGRYEDAGEAFRDVIERDTTFAEAYLLLGVLELDFLADGSQAEEHLIRYTEEADDPDPRAEDWIVELQEQR